MSQVINNVINKGCLTSLITPVVRNVGNKQTAKVSQSSVIENVNKSRIKGFYKS